MTVHELLARLDALDARVIPSGDSLRLDAPAGAITPELREEIVRHKPLLIDLVRTRASFAQQRLWFVSQLLPDNPMYNVPAVLRLRGAIDVDRLELALSEVVRRHEALRTTFRDEHGRTLQVIHPPSRVHVAVDFADSEARAKEIAMEEAERPFDLRKDLMLRARLVRLGENDAKLLITLHHIASDGWSMKVLFDELSALYAGRELPELPVQYADYAAWQRAQNSDAALAYWREQLEGVEVLEVPSDRPRPAQLSYRGDKESLQLDADLSRRIHELARDEQSTLFMILAAAYALLLQRTTGRTDVAIGSPVAGRDRGDVEELIGFFVNSIVLRVRTEGPTSFRKLVADMRRIVLDAFAHQDVPFERLVEVLQPQRDVAHNPLFQTIFALRHEGSRLVQLGDVEATIEDFDVRTAKFDLGMEVEEREGALTVRLSYASDLFDAATARRMLGHYETLLRSAVATPDRDVALLNMLTPAEHAQLAGFNDTTTPYEAQLWTAATPVGALAAIEVTAATGVTAVQIDRRANALAHELIEQGAGPEVAIGVQMERSIDMLVALVAIAKAGAAYVPIDPTFPETRRRLIARDAKVKILLENVGTGERDDAPVCRATPDNLAYITYTSGSTGTPKGVAVPRRAVARLARNNDFAPLTSDDVVLMFAPLAFDASTFEVWSTLLNGATLVIMPARASLEELGAAIQQHRVTALWLTAGLFNLMVEQRLQDFAGVKQLLAGGDVHSPSHVERVLRAHPGITVINGYGPTENTTFTACHRMSDPDAHVNIGRPIRNTRVHILDRNLQPLPVGVAGELFAAGDGLARGYVNDAALTAEKFIPLANGERLYRTGDLAKWRPDGTIDFLGRIDRQVKIRGYRIELGEIESVLRTIEGVADAVVIAREEQGDKRLIAYVIGNADVKPLLRALLPDYMIPSAIVALDAFPLNANGKVDRDKLPAPERPRATVIAAPASSDTERRVAEAWEAVLGVTGIGVHDNFFDAGGHSLLLLQLRTRLVEAFGKDIPLMEMFRKPTIRAMADFLDAKTAPMAATGVVHDHNQRAQMRRMTISKRKQINQERQNRS
jgi:aspartate racemase